MCHEGGSWCAPGKAAPSALLTSLQWVEVDLRIPPGCLEDSATQSQYYPVLPASHKLCQAASARKKAQLQGGDKAGVPEGLNPGHA